MAMLRDKPELASVPKETKEEYPSNGQLRNTTAPTKTVKYISQVSEENEGIVFKNFF